FDLIETVKKRFDENSISIPYPQLDVHMEHH
ncbi:mechanosensitive ion channel family protein, partial [Candidatus Nomurabacteria bacterium]|nr:mechanosensitive ion channel family protein [Candidatus Nomurabacteria bacterium]